MPPRKKGKKSEPETMSQNVATKKRDQTAKKIIAAIAKSNGLISEAAEAAGVSRKTIERYVRDYPTVAEAVEHAREQLFDFAESKLFEKINAGSETAIIFFLKTRCKHRGYIEKQEVEIPKDIVLRVVYDDSGGSKSN